ncbi:hypothetical protein [Marinobacter zhejiangensis]|uniref:SMI1/KNR4 family protein n=1 Tax=Marinobacter zhejiangensis TaxID=488535 RepID=A0A1I4P392_9GAMM|nr:hypothetical protein [Marinobacter zhejiangensis]SFM22271.1 hypothetical protein SAMN04487963_1785 [Marinobacter zhejiangensis]
MDIPRELQAFLSQNIPPSRQIDIGFELFEFPDAEQLTRFQEGYRWHGLTGERSENWKEHWIVFGASNADPLIYSAENHQVLFDRHGAGGWNPVLLFASLGDMLRCFGELSDIVADAGDQLYDDDFTIQPEYVQAMKSTIVRQVGPEHGNKVIECLEIREY